MSERRRVSDEELSDLIDGRLDATTKAEIERLMARDPVLARRYAVLLEQDRMLARLGAEILSEPVPDKLRAILADPDRKPGQGEIGQGANGAGPKGARGPQVLALVAGIVAGIAGGWFGHAQLTAHRGGLFRATLEQAAISHRLFEVDVDKVIENLGEGDVLPAATLPDIFSTPVRAPALRGSGWVPVGLRAETGSAGTAMQIAYADEDGTQVTLYVRRVDESDDVLSNVVEAEGYKVLYWLDGPMLYALVGDVEEGVLSSLARDVYASRAVGGRWTDEPVPAVATEPAPTQPPPD